MSRRWMVPVVALAVVLLTGAVAWACPGCRDALASNDGGPQGDTVSGYFWSILFMMGMPFAIFGTFAGCMYRTVRRAQKSQAASEQDAG